MSDVRFQVQKYLSEGWSVIPIPKGSKAPEEKDWVNREFGVGDFAEDSNIGVRLGKPSGNLIDVDLDCPEAVIAARSLMPETTRRHGRPGVGTSHYWYFGEVDSEKWLDTDGKVLIEIRSTGGQTVIPPSLHPSGELLYWDCDRHPAVVEPLHLRGSALAVATAALLARHWPSGSRHVAARDVAGFLASRDLDGKQIEAIVRAAATAAGDDEVEDRARVARDTYTTFKAGAKTTGAPTLEASVGKEVVARLLKWYGTNTNKFESIVTELNQTLFVVTMGKDVVIGQDDLDPASARPTEFMSEHAMQLLYANKLVRVGMRKKKGKDEEGQDHTKDEPVFETKFAVWKRHPKRREYRSLVFAPPPLVPDERDYNLWKGFAVQPLRPPEGSDALVSAEALREWADREVLPQCSRYMELVYEVICGGEPHRQDEYFKYLIDLMALTCQMPGEPSEVAVVLKGDRGVGKGMYITNFGKIFGRHFKRVAKPEQIVGKFNATVSGAVVLFADEAFYAGDKRDLGALKVLITDEVLRIERKGIDPVEESNFVHLWMASNEDWHTPAGFHERRFFALSVNPKRMQDHAFFEKIKREMRGVGRQALFTYLMTRDISEERRQELRAAPRTDELRKQQERSLTPEMRWWKGVLTHGELDLGGGQPGEWPTDVSPISLHNCYIQWCDQMKVNRRMDDGPLTRDVLAPWLGGRARRRDNGSRVYKRSLLPLAEARAMYDQISGVQTPWEDDEAPMGKKVKDDDLPF